MHNPTPIPSPETDLEMEGTVSRCNIVCLTTVPEEFYLGSAASAAEVHLKYGCICICTIAAEPEEDRDSM